MTHRNHARTRLIAATTRARRPMTPRHSGTLRCRVARVRAAVSLRPSRPSSPEARASLTVGGSGLPHPRRLAPPSPSEPHGAPWFSPARLDLLGPIRLLCACARTAISVGSKEPADVRRRPHISRRNLNDTRKANKYILPIGGTPRAPPRRCGVILCAGCWKPDGKSWPWWFQPEVEIQGSVAPTLGYINGAAEAARRSRQPRGATTAAGLATRRRTIPLPSNSSTTAPRRSEVPRWSSPSGRSSA